MSAATKFSQFLYHGTRADLAVGDLITVGHDSNFRRARPLSWLYFASTLDAAIWGGRSLPPATAARESMSSSQREPLRIIAEFVDWIGHSDEQVRQMKDGLAKLTAEGANHIID